MFARISNVGSLIVVLTVAACSGSEPTEPTNQTPTVASITLSATQVSLVPGQPQDVQATARDAGGTVITSPGITWTSGSNAVATVASDGRITGVAVGNTTVTAKAGTAEVSVPVTVTDGAYVTSAGGSFIMLGGKVQLDIPPNAVSTPTVLTARVEASPPASARLLAGTGVVVEPAVSFASIVRIRLAYSGTLGADVVEPQLRVARFVTDAWRESPVVFVDRTNHRAWGYIAFTGTFAILVPQPSLRSHAQQRGFDIGAAVDIPEMQDTTFMRVFTAEFNSLTPGNAMKFGPIHPQPTTYSFANADTIVGLAVQNGMKIHGHVLVWHNQQPAWISAPTQTRATLLAALKDHIETVVGRYAGKIATWDVANEVIADDGTGFRKTFWMNVIGPDVLDSAFTWAHRRDPSAKLFLNDYNVEGVNRKSDSLFAVATRLKAAGIPIDGVGLQAHFQLGAPTLASMQANLTRFANAGFDIRFTELDVRLADGTDGLAGQATIYGNTLTACRAQPRCHALTVWGVTDKWSWVPGTFPGFGRALPFDASYAPKPAYNSLMTVLQQP
ncbi:MAG TPA: endo-1,4-beta-xylanase [Gemmatimonadaceae bacterium]|nr:endo-1,4-beta-xylanase [Gemmatimonadaceae bacterium]